jgi:uncharacterized damage-inducible protein DinB
MESGTAQLNVLVKMTLAAWDAQNSYLFKLITSLTDEQLANEIAPARNTGIYLFGHLVAVNDAMLPLMGFGDRLFPALENVFINNPDKSGLAMPTVTTLKENLKAINEKLAIHFQSASADEWLSRHMSVSPEDFIKEPQRNKLNIVISRTHHMAYHLGQMQLLNQGA